MLIFYFIIFQDENTFQLFERETSTGKDNTYIFGECWAGHEMQEALMESCFYRDISICSACFV